MIKITIKGDVPSKKNSRNIFVRGGKPVNIPSKRYKEWHELAFWEVKRQIKNLDIPNEPLWILATFFPRTKRRFDLSNAFESVADLLVDAGIISDDNCYVLPRVSLLFGGVDKENPRVDIEVSEYKRKINGIE